MVPFSILFIGKTWFDKKPMPVRRKETAHSKQLYCLTINRSWKKMAAHTKKCYHTRERTMFKALHAHKCGGPGQ